MFQRLYSPSEVRKAIDTYSRVRSFRKAARICGIGKSTIQRWWIAFHSLSVRARLQKKKAPKRQRTPKFPQLLPSLCHLFSTSQVRFLTLKNIGKALGLQKNPSISWLSKALKKAKISRRRFQNTIICPKDSSQLKTLYVSFHEQLLSLDSKDIVCIDETAFSNVGNTSYGYFPKGKHPESRSVPKKQRVSLIMAIHPSKGILSYKKQLNPFDKVTFLAFLKESLLPSLPSGTKAVLMDNIRFHHSKEVLELLESAGIRPLFIPPYSPRCNPIEEVFSMLKRKFRELELSKGSFLQHVEEAVEELKLFKDLSPYYQHVKEHVQTQCQALEL